MKRYAFLSLLSGFLVFCNFSSKAVAEIYSLQMHLHGSLSEGSATMMGHTLQAEKHGLDVLWWSDHMERTMLTPIFDHLAYFDFEKGMSESYLQESAVSKEWKVYRDDMNAKVRISEDFAFTGSKSLQVKATVDDGAPLSKTILVYETRRNLLRRSLLSEIRLQIAVHSEPLEKDSYIKIKCQLSSDTAGVPNTINYIISNGYLPADESPNSYYIPLDHFVSNTWNVLSMAISEDARRLFPESDDQSLRFIYISANGVGGSTFNFYLDDLQLKLEGPTGDSLFAKQYDVLQERYAENLTQLTGWEITEPGVIFAKESGLHLNAFLPTGKAAQVIDFDSSRWSHADFPGNIIRHIQGQGGLVSYNHLFGTGKIARSAELVESITEELISNRLYGADLLEVGYLDRGLPLQSFLSVWDQLSVANIVVTGTGVSDHHEASSWESSSNPFVTWVLASRLTAPKLIASLKRGRAFFGDPRLLANFTLERRKRWPRESEQPSKWISALN